jgi:predicted house-cleaning noncanonical NTP pyrophosphatase (MazG superfamily)
VGKLVRDRIPEIIRADGGTPSVRVLGETEYRAALGAKLVEEAVEASQAEPSGLLEELADVFEVLRATCASSGWTMRDVERAADRKNSARGAFTERYFLE